MKKEKKISLERVLNFPRNLTKFIILFNLILLISTSNLLAQGREITGKITAQDGTQMPGVTVSIEGTTRGVIADTEGNYSIVADGPSNVLVFTFVGMKTEHIIIGSQSIINVTMQEDLLNLGEVVVIGYGTIRKEDVTTAISSVKAEDFNVGSVRDAGQLIQGKVAGLSITSPSGDPTNASQIMLRGITSIFSSTSPLILIDGIPGDLNTVAPQDIESMDVLKDGSAAAIYGTRGTNGVILITTKKGKGNTPTTIEYNGYVNIQTIARRPELLTASDYRRLNSEEGMSLIDYGYETDWIDEILKDNPVSYMNNFSLKGGNNTSNYIATINTRSEQGIFIKSGVNQLNGRLDINHSMFNNMLKINAGITGNNVESPSTTAGGNFNSYAYNQAIRRNPTDRVKDDDGKWINRGIYMYDNPVSLLEETSGYSKARTMRLYGNISFTPVPGLESKLMLSRYQRNQELAFYRTSKNPESLNLGQKGYASRSYRNFDESLLEFTTEYKRVFGNHRVSLLGGYSYQESLNETFGFSNYDFPSDEFTFDNLSLGGALLVGKATTQSYRSLSKLVGFFGRLNYNYNDRYLLLASLRYEGSTKFGDNNKWGMFPAVSLGWRLTEESFMENITLFDELKIRAGYGVTGTVPTDPYLSLTRLSYGSNVLVNGVWIKEITPASNPNPDLRWEKKVETNVGLDMAFLNNRINVTFDYYYRLTKDMLWNYQVPTPPYLYSSIVANVGSIENSGLELMMKFIPVKMKNFDWASTITYSTNKNKLKSLSNDLYKTTNDFFDTGYTTPPIQASTHRVKIGEPIGNFWGWKVVDIDENGYWIIENPDGDLVGSADKTPDDMQILGNGLPKHYASWNNAFNYKDFGIEINMRGAFGFQILNFQRMFFENPSSLANYNNLASGLDLVFDKVRLKDIQDYNSYYIENGDYWKVDNITLGYDFNVKSIEFIKSSRVYVSVLNLMTITGYKGIDPEVNRNGLSPGNDPLDKYPTTRTYTLGFNISF